VVSLSALMASGALSSCPQSSDKSSQSTRKTFKVLKSIHALMESTATSKCRAKATKVMSTMSGNVSVPCRYDCQVCHFTQPTNFACNVKWDFSDVELSLRKLTRKINFNSLEISVVYTIKEHLI
jgi:hypothetical protein